LKHLFQKLSIQVASVSKLTCGGSKINLDAQNVLDFMRENEEYILLFKRQGEEDEEYGVLKKEDFAIVYMDAFQEDLLRQFGDKVIAYDVTRKTGPDDFILHSILVLDEKWEGVAVAFLLSNENNATMLEIFLDCIKKKVGPLSPLTVMIDMETTFLNAFTVVMGPPLSSLWRMWHVYEEWRLNLSKIKDKNKRKRVLITLYQLSQIADLDKFQKEFEDFLNDADPDLKTFIDYFKKNYAHTAQYWAYCYRVHSNINVNMIAESFQNYFKNKTVRKKNIETIDQCLYIIKSYLIMIKKSRKLKELSPQKIEKRKILRQRHHKARRNYRHVVVEHYESDESPFWLVSSFPKEIQRRKKTKSCRGSYNKRAKNVEDDNDDLQMYIVPQRLDGFINSNGLKCSLCKVLFDAYTCTCTDYLMKQNMCKHIHVVAMYCKEKGLTVPSIADMNYTNHHDSVTNNNDDDDDNNNNDEDDDEISYIEISEISIEEEPEEFIGNETKVSFADQSQEANVDESEKSNVIQPEEPTIDDPGQLRKSIIDEILNISDIETLQRLRKLIFCK
jgi:hypothetical protein